MGSGSSISRNSYEKKCGDEAFKLGNYQEAIIWYSVSLINLENSSQHDNQIRNILLSNRSAAYYMNKQYLLSLYDAKSVIELNSQWSKGYFRAAKACEALHRFNDALQYYQHAQALSEPDETLNNAILCLQPDTKVSQGSVLTWGLGETCALGHPDLRDRHIPTIVEALRGKHIVDISCGTMHTVAVTGTGEVYSWGQNKYGQVGIMTNEPLQFIVPRLMADFFGIHVAAVSCGAGHTLALSSDGRVFSWGMGGYGQLGHGNLENRSTPSQIVSLQAKSIVAISCGLAHSIFLNGMGKELLGCGMNTYGALGFKTTEQAVMIPSNVPLPHQLSGSIVYVSCGGAHTALVDESGKLYLSGSNTCGQLGIDKMDIDFISTFTAILTVISNQKVVSVSEFVYVACGEEFTIAITKQHQVYATGLGIAGQMGNDSQENNYAFTHIESLDIHCIEEVCCSQGVVFGVSRSGEVWSWGISSHDLNGPTCDRSSVPQLYDPLRKKKGIRFLRCGRRHYTAVIMSAYGPTTYIRNLEESTIRVGTGKKMKLIVQCCDIIGKEISFTGCALIGHLIKLSTESDTESDIPLFIDDNFDGTFSVETADKMTLSGEYQLTLTIDDLNIAASPCLVIVNSGEIASIQCTLFALQYLNYSDIILIPNELAKFKLEFFDQYQNRIFNLSRSAGIELVIRILNERGTVIFEKIEIINHQVFEDTLVEVKAPSELGSYSIIFSVENEFNEIKTSIPCQVSEISDHHFQVGLPSLPSVEEEIKLTLTSNSRIFDNIPHLAITSTITPSESSLSARALIQLYKWNQDPCTPVRGISTKCDSSNIVNLSHRVKVSGRASVNIFIDNKTVYSSEIHICSGKVDSTFCELIRPREILSKWDAEESERILTFLLRDRFGNPCDTTSHQDLTFFAEEWKDTGSSTPTPLLTRLVSKNLLEVCAVVLDSDRNSEYYVNVGIITVKKERQQFQYSPFCIGTKDVEIPLFIDQSTAVNPAIEIKKIQQIERTKQRAADALKLKQKSIRDEKERNRVKRAARRTGGGFIVQYSQDI